MVIEGIEPFSRLQMSSGASVTIDMENRPCIFPGQEIEKDRPGFGRGAGRHSCSGRCLPTEYSGSTRLDLSVRWWVRLSTHLDLGLETKGKHWQR